MQTLNFRKTLSAGLLIVASLTVVVAQKTARPARTAPIPTNVLLRIVQAEDERKTDDHLISLLNDKDSPVRKRAALALGRIGDERALPALSAALKSDPDNDVRQMCAFAIGEIESATGAEALIGVIEDAQAPGEVRARAVEGLGKIGAVLLAAGAAQTPPPKIEDKTLTKIKFTVWEALKFELGRGTAANHSTILLGLTAALRVRPDGGVPLIVQFLGNSDPLIVATALNTLARLRAKDNNEQVRQLLNHADPLVRANAARVIGAAEDKGAFDALLSRALTDADLRVRVSAIRALGSLKDARAADPLLNRGTQLLNLMRASSDDQRNEILEIVSVIGGLLRNSKSEKAITWLRAARGTGRASSPEVEIAMARIDPEFYVTEEMKFGVGYPRVIAQGISEIATIKKTQPELDRHTAALTSWMHDLLTCKPTTSTKCLLEPLSVAPFLQAYAAFKPADLDEVLRAHLHDADVVVRSTAADLLGEQPPSEANARALVDALPRALLDKDLDDAALSTLAALAKQKSPLANDAIKTALDSSELTIRRRAAGLLKANGVGDFTNRIGTIRTRNTANDYRRALARTRRRVTATIVTSRGSFTIEFFAEAAPLTVDNFVQLARKGYFNGQTIPRVVPNFVVQAGDPRGDQSGGPGYQIRCEVNEAPFERAAVGMALSGKDTGGSQWFVTHSPQPHLDGGYTVFGRVISGMDVIDRIVRGDTIRRVIVNER